MKKTVVPNYKLRYTRLLPLFCCIGMLLGGGSVSYAQVGTVWAWGSNGEGQLGNGTVVDSTTLTAVSKLTNVVQVTVGHSHSLALKLDGTVWAWGDNFHGQIGNGTTVNRYTPQQVAGLANVVQVVGASSSSLALKADGTVWAWGSNTFGQLGDGTTLDRKRPVQVKRLTGVAQISAGGNHSLALKLDGTVWAWGYNGSGQLGDGTLTGSLTPVQVAGFDALTLTHVAQVAAGYSHSLALLRDGTVWGWGDNGSGQLGDGTSNRKRSPIQVSKLNGVVQISTRGHHSLAVKSDGTAWAWGNNSEGELGDGTHSTKFSPVQVVNLTGVAFIVGCEAHSFALLQDGTVWGWGSYVLLLDGTRKNKYSPVPISALQGQTLSVGSYGHGLSVQATLQETQVSPANVTAPYGKSFVAAATLANALGGLPLNETLAFSVDGNSVGTATTTLGGVASLIAPASLSYTVGTHTLSVAFTGSRLYNASNGAATLTITPADTAIKTSTFAGRPGDTRGLYATLKRKTDNVSLSNQPLTFKVDGDTVGTATTDGTGKATLPYKLDETYSVGSHALTIEYAGDSNHNASIGTGTLNIVQAPSGILGSSVSGKAGVTVTLKGKLTRKTDGALLIGRTVRFQIDGVEVGSAVTDGLNPTTLAYTIPADLSTGAHVITLLFEGDALYLSASDISKNLTVK